MGLAQLTQGKGFKQLMSKLYGFGAAIVIVGALFKIQHWEGAGIMLTIGLLTEAVIFFFSAFEPPHEEVDWSLVYPELAGMHEPGSDRKKAKAGDPVAQHLDKLLADAKIGPELITSLGNGLKSLSENTAKMATVSNAAVATEEYSKNVAAASKQVTTLTASYEKAATAMNSMSAAHDDVKGYTEQMKSAGKNMAALNAVYELQLQEASTRMKDTKKFYDGIQDLLANLNNTVEDTKRYKDEVGKLAKNLNSLNTIYGNMLSAMNPGANK
ncbi:MAG: gliding motility protein GldL [Nitrosomonas sp.]